MTDVKAINIQTVSEDNFYGEFAMDFLPRGYGYTLGTPLRRSLLTYMQGSAITTVKINGVKHEFTTITGIKEDVLRIILNLKKVVVRNLSDKPQTLILNVKGAKIITAGDIDENPNVEIINKDQVIADLTIKASTLEMELTVENGIGYVIADNLKRTKIGTIPLDANFSPIERVSMDVLPTRSGQENDLDKLVLKIWTKGNVRPSEALYKAINHVRDVFSGMNGLDVETEMEQSSKKAEKVVKKKTIKKVKK